MSRFFLYTVSIDPEKCTEWSARRRNFLFHFIFISSTFVIYIYIFFFSRNKQTVCRFVRREEKEPGERGQWCVSCTYVRVFRLRREEVPNESSDAGGEEGISIRYRELIYSHKKTYVWILSRARFSPFTLTPRRYEPIGIFGPPWEKEKHTIAQESVR